MTNSISLTEKKEQQFQRLVLLTTIVIYLLILAGGIVRGTGSGMGCPDWPKCFGRWVPPTEVSQLPNNYQEIYGAKLKGEIEFNAVKTWIEYVNRLLGVLSGFFVLGTFLTSLSYLHRNKAVVLGSFVALVLIGLNGWLGSRVVATELAQYMITAHLLLAIAVVFTLLFVFVKAHTHYLQSGLATNRVKSLRWLLLIVMALTLVQTIFGTQVREGLDSVVRHIGYEHRESWISNLGVSFYIHRSFSLIILALHVAVIHQLRKVSGKGGQTSLAGVLIVLVVLEIATGVTMAYFGVPAFAQPIHLELAMLLLGVQFVIWLSTYSTSQMTEDGNTRFKLVEV